MKIAYEDLRLDPKDQRWVASGKANEQPFKLRSEMTSAFYDEATARGAFDHVASVIAREWDAILGEIDVTLRALYNDSWRDEDEPELDGRAFRTKLAISSVHLSEPDNPSKLFTLYFTDGDLFGGHFVEVAREWDGRALGRPSLAG